MYLLFSYLISIAPAGLLAAALLALLPKARVSLRVSIYILFFMFARDAMGPHGFWRLAPGTLVVTAGNETLLALALMCAALCLTVLFLETPACSQLRWWPRQQRLKAIGWGITGAIFIGVVVHLLKNVANLQPMTNFSPGFHSAILVFALAGNLFEELMFRGILQSRLALTFSPLRAITLSTLLFSFCHIWLTQLTSGAGISVLVFTLIEGWVAGFVYWRSGLIAATLAHGLAIYGLATGMY